MSEQLEEVKEERKKLVMVRTQLENQVHEALSQRTRLVEEIQHIATLKVFIITPELKFKY